ncbi:MAG: hypothetical protein VKP62_02035 [Candidatus Sericytochromatia bacterium]|nr:hypothetical protein [Candidatus Sericytochromatia bacterium]
MALVWRVVLLLAWVLWPLAACMRLPAGTGIAMLRAPTGAVFDAADGGSASARVTLSLPVASRPRAPRSLLALGPPKASEVSQVVVTLYRVDGGTEVPLGVRTLSGSQLSQPLIIRHLRANTSYRLRGEGYGEDSLSAANLLTLPASDNRNMVGWLTTNDDAALAVTLRLQLLAGPQALVSLVAGVLEPPDPNMPLTFGTPGPKYDGLLGRATLAMPTGMVVNSAGTLYIADTNHHCIRQVTPGGLVTTLAGSGYPGHADGTGPQASFQQPLGLALDASGTLYVADLSNHRIRKVTPEGVVTTLAGSSLGFADGEATAAQFSRPHSLAIDASGTLYVSDSGNHLIRTVTASGVVSTLAGSTQGFADDLANAARFDVPQGLVRDASGTLYVADRNNQRIRRISAGTVSTLAGTGAMGNLDGPGTTATFTYPNCLALASDGTLRVADLNNRIRSITPAGEVSHFSGPAGGDQLGGYRNGPANSAQYKRIQGMVAAPGQGLYVSEAGLWYGFSGEAFSQEPWLHRIRTLTAGGDASTLIEDNDALTLDGGALASSLGFNVELTVDGNGQIYLSDENTHRIRRITPGGQLITVAGSSMGFEEGTGSQAQFSFPWAVAVDASGTLYVVDGNNNRIRRISAAGVVTTLAGSTSGYQDGSGATAQFSFPRGGALGPDGNLYVTDNNRVRMVTPAGEVTTLAGSSNGYQDGLGAAARFASPQGLAVDASGTIYVADTFNHRIRKVTPGGEVSTLAGSSSGYQDGAGASARFTVPTSVAVDASGTVYVADKGNHRVRKITPAGLVSTLAGADTGSLEGPADAVTMYNASALAIGPDGSLYVFSDRRIRRIR